MSEQPVPHVSSDNPADTEADAIRADIERTRAELADTAGALAAKLDVKAQARQSAHAAADRVTGAVHDATPEPVQRVLTRAQDAARPVVAKAGEDRRRTLLVSLGAAGAVLVGVLLARRARH